VTIENGPEDEALLADSVGLALLVVPETLAWTERFKAHGKAPPHLHADGSGLAEPGARREADWRFIERRTTLGGDGRDNDPSVTPARAAGASAENSF
jgi:hypothetical protein